MAVLEEEAEDVEEEEEAEEVLALLSVTDVGRLDTTSPTVPRRGHLLTMQNATSANRKDISWQTVPRPKLRLAKEVPAALVFLAIAEDDEDVVMNYVAITQEDEEDVPDFCEMSFQAEESPYEFIIDSGATAHMCNNINLFYKIRKLDRPKKILMGNTTFVRTEYEGEIRISSSTDPSGFATIHRVLYTPQMSKNLISVAQMMLSQQNYQVLF